MVVLFVLTSMRIGAYTDVVKLSVNVYLVYVFITIFFYNILA